MGYLDIQNREKVDEIIQTTLSQYYKTTVCVSNKYRKGCFILNPKLSISIHDSATRRIKKLVQKRFAIHGSFLKSIAMKLFIMFGFSRMGFWGCKYLEFERLPSNPESLLIMPGNMKIKVFDYHSNSVFNILKDGFSDVSIGIEREIRTGKDLKPYILPMKVIDDNNYSEELLSGCSIDRLDRRVFPNVEEEVKIIIRDIQLHNREMRDGEAYFQYLIDEIQNRLKRINCDDYLKESIIGFAERLHPFVGKAVIVSDSHGDLQNGNVFIANNNRIYIIDWETFGKRSIGYDLLTYYYKFRYRTNYLQRIEFFLKDENWKLVSESFGLDGIDKTKVLAVYFLEDLIWVINECECTPEKKESGSLEKYAEKNFQDSIIARLIEK